MSTVQLIGQHISYSASPAMHAAAFAALGLGHSYELADVSAEELPAAVASLRSGGVLGANVTVPHKAAVIDHLDEIEPLAAEAEAVNTIVVRRGRLIGSNTDVPAIAEQLRKLRPAPRVALVLGAGGAARAVRLALESLGPVEVVMLSRSSWMDLPHLLTDADLLVNATPIGTNSDETPVEQRLLHSGLAVLDLVYRPSPTRLVSEARKCGLDARSGAGVLLGQGWRSLEAWLGHTVGGSVEGAMAAALRHDLRQEADV
jgi:shikimate dehydrogenase